MISHKPFGVPDGHRLVNIAAPAFLLAKGGTNPAANQGEGVLFPMDFQAFGILPLGNQGDKRRDIHLGRAGVGTTGPNQALAGPGRTFPVQDV